MRKFLLHQEGQPHIEATPTHMYARNLQKNGAASIQIPRRFPAEAISLGEPKGFPRESGPNPAQIRARKGH